MVKHDFKLIISVLAIGDVNEGSTVNQPKKRKISHNRKRVLEDVNPIIPIKRSRGRPRKIAA